MASAKAVDRPCYLDTARPESDDRPHIGQSHGPCSARIEVFLQPKDVVYRRNRVVGHGHVQPGMSSKRSRRRSAGGIANPTRFNRLAGIWGEAVPFAVKFSSGAAVSSILLPGRCSVGREAGLRNHSCSMGQTVTEDLAIGSEGKQAQSTSPARG